jgi:SpoVK/Ycf46/Vps4 family AAA+-type ATPase
MTVLTKDFPMYQRSQAIYALNIFPVENKDCEVIKITNMTDEGEQPPSYERIRIKRRKKMTLMTIGEFYIKYKNEPLILELYFYGYTMRGSIFAKSDSMDIINEFQDEFSKYMRKHNFHKGERLVFQPRANLEFLEYPKMGWDDVVLKPEVKETIMLNILFPLKNKKSLVKKNVPWRRGLLMGGVAGTGKTQVCRILCNILPKGTTLIWATPKALYDTDQIQNLFDAARYFSPCLIVIEDIDFIGKSRDLSQNPILGELLTQLDGNDPNHGIFVIASSNRPELLDEALANRPSRFDVKVEFPLPELDERKKLIRLFTKNMTFEKPNDFNSIAAATKELTGAHIKEVFVYAQLRALKNGHEKIRTDDVMERVRQYQSFAKPKAYRK